MLKRKATLDAKKAQKEAAKAAKAAEADTIHPLEVARPTPVASAPHVPPPIITSAPSSGTRTSGRKRKLTSRALGSLDGANDSDDEEVPAFKSEYDHFQALSSPGTPALGKRKSKQLYNLAAFVGSDEEDSY
jgi:hypothetical protein